MKLFTSEEFNSLNDLFINQLQDLYDAEQRITKALPKMTEAATSADLKRAFNIHLHETHQHVTRLEQIFTELGQPTERETCVAMKGIIDEGEEMINAKGQPAVKDAALIAAAQRVEHYEMAGYGTAKTFAIQLGKHKVADLLTKTLNEEKAADAKLTQVAETNVNVSAAGAR
jgi:ferritin-like metal-binding protein YciE